MTTLDHAGIDDLDSLVELESLLFVEDAAFHDRHADVTWPRREGADDFKRILASDASVVLVAREEELVVGMVVGYTTQSSPTRQPVTYAVLRSMYVRSGSRGEGIGQQLTEAFVVWARDRDCVEVRVDSYFENASARRLYERVGFTPQSVAHVMQL